MRKVMCINDKEFGNAHKNPAVGEICTVSKSFIDTIFDFGDPVFTFYEYGNRRLYSQRYFAILPDQPEEVIEELEEYTA